MTIDSAPQTNIQVPFFRPSITDAEIDEVVACLRSGWLTTGRRAKQFETDLAECVGADHAIALNSCTAALHLAVEALGLAPNQAVLLPSLTFAATAAIVCQRGAMPLLVDCDPVTLNIDLDDAARKIDDLKAGRTPLPSDLEIVGIIPVHVGGNMINMEAVAAFAKQHNLWVVEYAAHALPAAYRPTPDASWRRCGENTAAVTCYSFYANKTITTGEGGMAVTSSPELADRMRRMSLHGLSHDAWKRYSGGAQWDYRIVAPGFKYNMTDIAAAIGIHQLERAESMRLDRERIAGMYFEMLGDLEQLELPVRPSDRIHSWHLFPIRLHLDRVDFSRNEFMAKLREHGVGCSVHWRPLHLHPYYQETCGWTEEALPVATSAWERLVSLPLFPGMQTEEQEHVCGTIRHLLASDSATPTSTPIGKPR